MAAKRQSQETTDALIKKDVENIINDVKDLKKDSADKDKNYFIVFVEQKEREPYKRLIIAMAGILVSIGLLVLGGLINK